MTVKLNLHNLKKPAQLYGRSVISLAFNLGGIAAGFFLATSESVIGAVSWGLLLYPSVLSVKGAIGGMFSGRLSTALHIGTIRPTLTDNTEHFHVLTSTMASLSLIASIVMWAYACIFGLVFIGLTAADVMMMLIVMIATMALAFAAISPVTVLVSFVAMRKGLDPDIVTYPVISTVADVLVTIIYLIIVALSNAPEVMTVLLVIVVIFSSIILKMTWTNRNEKVLRRAMKEFLSVLFVIGFFVNIAGSALDRISQAVASVPHIYAVYPAIICTVGDVGSIIGSTSTTKLSLGTIQANLRSFRQQLEEIASAWAASLTMFLTYGLAAALLFGVLDQGIFIIFIGRLVLTNIPAVATMVFISIFLTMVTYNRGLDPDNFVIPIGSAIADGLTSVFLLLSILLIV